VTFGNTPNNKLCEDVHSRLLITSPELPIGPPARLFNPLPTATMLARRACASVRNISHAQLTLAVRSKSFTATASAQSPSRAPALADITPSSAASFTEKQREFRDSLITAQKQKEQQESVSLPMTSLAVSHAKHTPASRIIIRVTDIYRRRSSSSRARKRQEEGRGAVLTHLWHT
jgi:cell pole-organizing protein PopZ